MSAYEDFNSHFAEINDLCCVINLLTWDSRTQMPPGGAGTRGQQLATVTRLAQARFVSEETGRLIDRAVAEIGADTTADSADSYRLRAVHQAREAYDIARRVPQELLGNIAALKAPAQQVWAEAKNASDFARFAPYLEQMLSLTRRMADAIGYTEHPNDALLLRYEPGMTASRLKVLFGQLKAGLLPLLQQVGDRSREVRADFLEREYPEDAQKAFALEIARAFGYDLNRGRLDVAPHPFEISFTREDVRITTRYNRRFPPMALFGTFHEAGHGLYEQGVDPALTRGVLTTDLLDLYAVGGTSYGAHESQSRLWENLVGRSRGFWQHHYPRFQQFFPEQTRDVTAEEFYRAVNRVRPSLIRVEADEVTYNLHIMLRVEIEMALLDGTLKAPDLPAAWNAAVQEYLGLTPPDDGRGVLQDVHWSTGLFGSFPTYTVGNVMSAQFMAAARQVPGLDAALSAGDYAPLLAWLTENVYRHGRAFSPEELLVRSTGQGLTVEPYLAYLNEKYTDLFPRAV
jgi:carboxypeptidase Taq